MTSALETLAERRREAVEEAERAHRALLDAVVAELDQGTNVNVRKLAVTAGIARATVYNELGRRQQTRDALSGNGHPAPAPADDDAPRESAGYPSRAGDVYTGGTLVDSLILRALDELATEDLNRHLDRGERVEDVRERVNAYRPRSPLGIQRVRETLSKLTRVIGPRPVVAVAARRGRTNYRLAKGELGRWVAS